MSMKLPPTTPTTATTKHKNTIRAHSYKFSLFCCAESTNDEIDYYNQPSRSVHRNAAFQTKAFRRHLRKNYSIVMNERKKKKRVYTEKQQQQQHFIRNGKGDCICLIDAIAISYRSHAKRIGVARPLLIRPCTVSALYFVCIYSLFFVWNVTLYIYINMLLLETASVRQTPITNFFYLIFFLCLLQTPKFWYQHALNNKWNLSVSFLLLTD